MAEMTMGQARGKNEFTHSSPSTYFIFMLSPLKKESCFIFFLPLSLEGETGIMGNSDCFKYPRKSTEEV